MLELTNIHKTFHPHTPNENKALQGIDLHLEQGDFVTVIGGNGAGKSTLLNIISGTLLPDQGNIRLEDKDITFSPAYKRAKNIGRLFQDPLKGTAPSMSIAENLALAEGRQKDGIKRPLIGIGAEQKQRFRERLEELDLGLEERLDSKVGLLSGGQRQALTLLMATMVPPKLLLLDEHTAALDPATAEKVLRLTKKIIHRHGITAFMVTHNMASALAYGNRLLMMDKGKIILDIGGEEKKRLTVEKLLQLFKEKSHNQLDNDRMLLS